jgi:hypothetical protein
MDTFAACVLATQLPQQNSKILEKTTPYNKGEEPMTPQMWLTIYSAFLYQQMILTILFYNG